MVLLNGIVLLFRQAVMFPVFLGGDTVLLFKGPEKAGVVLKSVLMVNMADGLVGQDGVLAGMKALFQDILVKGDPHIVLKYVGYVIFTHIKKGGQAVQAQITLQMPVNVVADVQVEHIFIDH